MKKLATTFGLLALMLIVTSFTTPDVGGGKGTKGTGTSQGGEISLLEVGGGKDSKGTGTSQGGELLLSYEIGGNTSNGSTGGTKGTGTSQGGE